MPNDSACTIKTVLFEHVRNYVFLVAPQHVVIDDSHAQQQGLAA